jgi:hypothetical protein
MFESSRMSGETFATERLRNDPQLSFEALLLAAEQAGVTIQPIQYGRARRQLGLTNSPPVARRDISEPVMPAVTNAPETPAPVDQPVVTIPRPEPIPILAAPSTPPKRKGSPAFGWLLESLRAEPTLSYGELQTRSTAKDYKIAPVMYGRAKALLGLVPVAPRGQGKNRKPTKLTPQQTLKQADATSADQFGHQLARVRNATDLVQIIKHIDDERRRLRGLLETVANTIDEALDFNNEAST